MCVREREKEIGCLHCWMYLQPYLYVNDVSYICVSLMLYILPTKLTLKNTILQSESCRS